MCESPTGRISKSKKFLRSFFRPTPALCHRFRKIEVGVVFYTGDRSNVMMHLDSPFSLFVIGHCLRSHPLAFRPDGRRTGKNRIAILPRWERLSWFPPSWEFNRRLGGSGGSSLFYIPKCTLGKPRP